MKLCSKFLLQKAIPLLVCMFGLLYAGTTYAQSVSIPSSGTVTTSFNGWNGTLPTGWAVSGSGATYRGTASTTTGGTYAIANAGFGYRPSSTADNVSLQGSFQNNTGAVITSITISYQAFVIASEARVPGWAVTSSLAGIGTNLNWLSSDGGTTAAPINKTITLTGLNIANNATFTLSFVSNRGTGSGSSPLIGMRNVTIVNNSVTCTPVTNTVSYAACSNQMPYSWGTQSLSSTGVYNQVFTTSVGNCDSTVTLNFSVRSTTTGTETLSKCPADFPFVWNGINVTNSTTYPQLFTTTGSNGCDSVVSLNVTKLSSSTGFEEMNVCAGAYPFEWHGNTVTSSEDEVSYSLTNSQGCDSVVYLLILPSTVSDTTQVTQNACTLPFTWYGQQVSEYGIDVASTTLQTTGGCDSVLLLTLVKPTADSITVTENVCANNLPFMWRGQSISNAGVAVAKDTLVNQNGCDSILYLSLNINTPDSVVVTATACSGSMPYQWRGQQINNAGVAVATDTLINQNGCDSVLYLTLVLSSDSLAFTDSICAGSLPYYWRGYEVNATGFSVATDTVSGNDCDVLYHLHLFFYSQPQVVISQPNAKCFPGKVNLANRVANSTTPNLQLTYYRSNWQQISQTNVGDSGLYYVVGTNSNGCKDTAIVNVTINPKPIVLTTNPERVCDPTTVDITLPTIVDGSTPGLTYTYWSNAAATQPVPNPYNTHAIGSKLYYIVGTNQFGCSDTTNVLTTINTKPTVVTYNPPATCAPNTVNLTMPILTYGSTANLNYTYWLSDFSAQVNGPSAVSESGTYHLIGKNASSCTDTGMFVVTINNCNQTMSGVAGNNSWQNNEESGTELNSIFSAMKLYPNPSSDFVNVTFDLNKNSNVTYWITDITGRILLNKQSNMATNGSNTITMSIAELVSGIYYFHLQTETMQQTKVVKFVVKR